MVDSEIVVLLSFVGSTCLMITTFYVCKYCCKKRKHTTVLDLYMIDEYQSPTDIL